MDIKQTVFITGGLGYIGLPTASALFEKGYHVVIFDRISPKKHYPFLRICGDIRNSGMLCEEMKRHKPSVVVHLAAVISVSESEKEKKLYFETNVLGTKNVLAAMRKSGCKKLLFASSAAVYDACDRLVTEDYTVRPLSYYGQTKKEAEQLIQKEYGVQSVILRYFNVVGDESIKKNSKLIASAVRVAKGLQKKLILYGSDYPTPDGTAIRDYVHIRDVVQANSMAVAYLENKTPSLVANIASGIGVSNLEVVKEVERQFHVRIPIVYRKKRKETVISIADIANAKRFLHWHPTHSSRDTIIQHYLEN